MFVLRAVLLNQALAALYSASSQPSQQELLGALTQSFTTGRRAAATAAFTAAAASTAESGVAEGKEGEEADEEQWWLDKAAAGAGEAGEPQDTKAYKEMINMANDVSLGPS